MNISGTYIAKIKRSFALFSVTSPDLRNIPNMAGSILWWDGQFAKVASGHLAPGATCGIAVAGSPEPHRSGGAGPAGLRDDYAYSRHDSSDS